MPSSQDGSSCLIAADLGNLLDCFARVGYGQGIMRIQREFYLVSLSMVPSQHRAEQK